jgi:two-component system chemotaxis response regulator CheB
MAEHATRDIITIGASAGGVEALRVLAAGFPAELPAAVFVVLHLAPDGFSVLPRILTRSGPLSAIHPEDGDPIRPGMIYVAPPDRHLLVERGRVRVTAGPRENRHRPSVDPLFRSAAHAYGPRVIGVILSGYGNDGTVGLVEVKRHGGLAVVQDPEDAFHGGMPCSALEFVSVDRCLPVSRMGAALSELSRQPLPPGLQVPEVISMAPHETTESNAAPRVEGPDPQQGHVPGPLEGFTCPDCNGHLWEIEEGGLLRYQCRVGHALTAESLLAGKLDSLETTLWASVNQFQESAAISAKLAARALERGHNLTAERLAERAGEAERHAQVLRELLQSAVFAPGDPDITRGDGVAVAAS